MPRPQSQRRMRSWLTSNWTRGMKVVKTPLLSKWHFVGARVPRCVCIRLVRSLEPGMLTFSQRIYDHPKMPFPYFGWWEIKNQYNRFLLLFTILEGCILASIVICQGFFAVFKRFGLEIQCKSGNFRSACQARHLWRWAGSSGPLGDVGRFFVCQDVGHCLLGVGCCRGLFAWDAWHFLLASWMRILCGNSSKDHNGGSLGASLTLKFGSRYKAWPHDSSHEVACLVFGHIF